MPAAVLLRPPVTTLLLVDDEPATIELVRVFLQRSGSRLATAANGEQALQMAVELKPDVILLDVMMPGMDGFETCRRLKENPVTRHIPVIFATARVEPAYIQQGFASGAADYVCKPLQRQELQVRVDNQLIAKRAADAQREHLQEAETLAQVGHLVAAVTHDIGSPISNSRLALDQLHESLVELAADVAQNRLSQAKFSSFLERGSSGLEIARSALQRASELVHSFKTVAVDQCAVRRYRINLHEYLGMILLTLRPTLRKRQIAVNVAGPERLELTTWPGALAQIVSNLVENSLAHGFTANRTGRIEIDFAVEGAELLLRYRDDGCGIAANHLPHIFDTWFTTAGESGGSGLGLSIVHSLVCKRLAGSIECESLAGQGVEFRMRMPIDVGE